MDEKDDKFDRSLSEYLETKQTFPDHLLPYRETLAKLESLREVSERDPDVQAIAREAFLQKAKSICIPVSKTSKRRLLGWSNFFKKELSPMTTIIGLVLAMVVAFGGAGTTVYAAQDSLPNEPLYGVKQLTEEIRLALTTDKEAEVHLLLDLTEERTVEMIALATQGAEVPEKTQLRFQEHLQLALSEAAQLDDAALKDALQRIQNMAQNQIRVMEQVQQNSPEDSPNAALQIAIAAMNRVRQEAEDGLFDPLTFRNRQGSNRPEGAPDQPENVPPGRNDDAETTTGEESPGQGNGDGSGDGGGAYGDGNGDGTGDGGGAYGNGNGDGTGDGDGAWSKGNGDGMGDGVCDCTCDYSECDCTLECTPQGPQNGSQGPKGGNN